MKHDSTVVSDHHMALPFMMLREVDHSESTNVFLDAIVALFNRVDTFQEIRSDLEHVVLRFSQQVELDTIQCRSVMIDGNTGVARHLYVTSLGATDRHVPAGNIALTVDAGLRPTILRMTVNRFDGIRDDAPDIVVCRDAWLADQR